MILTPTLKVRFLFTQMLLLLSRSLFISLSLSFLAASSPISMGLWILLIALSLSWIVGRTLNPWFAIIIFLVYIGGILIIFAYFSALTPNQTLNFSPLLFTFIPLFTTLLLLLSNMQLFTPAPFQLTLPLTLAPITILYTPRNCLLLLRIALILLLILVIVVKITNITKGPLRPFHYVQTYS